MNEIPSSELTPVAGVVCPSPHVTLFNDERYHLLNLRSGQRLFRYDHRADGRLVGALSGVVDGGVLDCGHSAPFGGVDFVRRLEPVTTVIGLLRAAAARAQSEGIDVIRLRARPGYFGPNETATEFALVNLGAPIESCELSLGIDTKQFSSLEDYMAAITDAARNAVRRGARSALTFEPAQTATEWAACFDVIADTKRRRGAAMKYSLDYLTRLRSVFGPRIAMHRLVKNHEVAAAALVYRIAPKWDFVAAWGDRLDYRRDRVMNLMTYYLVGVATTQRVAVLDLGEASVDGVPDVGLERFKRSLGAAIGLRLNFRFSTALVADGP